MPRLIPQPPNPLTIEQAEAIMGHYGYDAGELCAGIAATLRDRGITVHNVKVLDPAGLARFWPAESATAALAYVHYQPSALIRFDAIQIRLHKATGELSVWDDRGVLGEGTGR